MSELRTLRSLCKFFEHFSLKSLQKVLNSLKNLFLFEKDLIWEKFEESLVELEKIISPMAKTNISYQIRDYSQFEKISKYKILFSKSQKLLNLKNKYSILMFYYLY